MKTILDADAHGKRFRTPYFEILEDVAELLAPRFAQKIQQAQDKKVEEITKIITEDITHNLSNEGLLKREVLKEVFDKIMLLKIKAQEKILKTQNKEWEERLDKLEKNFEKTVKEKNCVSRSIYYGICELKICIEKNNKIINNLDN